MVNNLLAATWWPLLVAVLGLFFGSYLNVVALRWFKSKKSSPHNLKNRSECANCRKKLGWLEIIPLASFFYQQGKCKHCQVNISWRYPVVELSTALIFFGIAEKFARLDQLILLLLLAGIMIVIALIDLKTQLIPDKLSIPTMIVVGLFLLLTSKTNLVEFSSLGFGLNHWLVGLIIGSLVPALIVFVTKGRGMGVGDIKLGGLLGISLGGTYALVGLFCAFIIGAIVGLFLVFKNQANLKTSLPFGPFLVTGWLIAVLWGSDIVSWYTGISYL